MSLSKDGIDNIVLQFSRTPAMYRAGEDLTGRIVVVCDATTPGNSNHLLNPLRTNRGWG